MKKNLPFQRMVTFSIRKFTVGVCSVAIGASLLALASPSVEADETASLVSSQPSQTPIDYRYAAENELTAEEKSAIISSTPADLQGDQVYYLVYKKQENLAKILPQTGDSSLPLGILLAGAGTLVAVYVLKGGRRRLQGFILLLAISGQAVFMPVSALASHFRELSSYNRQLLASENPVLSISGYDYVGYFTKPVQDGQADSKARAASPEKPTEQVMVEEVRTAKGPSVTSQDLPVYDLSADIDHDGVANGVELAHNSNPEDASNYPNAIKGDAVTSQDLPTYDLAADSDNDTVPNGTELEYNSNPDDANSYPTVKGPSETSQDLPAYDLTADSDKDTVPNGTELEHNSNPDDANSYPIAKGTSVTSEDLPSYNSSEETITRETILPYPVNETTVSDLAPGQRRVLQQGQNGKISSTYKLYKDENGQLVREELLATRETAAIAEEVQVGAAVVKDDLQTAVQAARLRLEEHYSPESWARLQAALAQAESSLADPSQLQESVNQAQQALEEALVQLQSVNKPSLQLTAVDKNELGRAADLTYSLDRGHASNVQVQVKLYQEGGLLESQTLTGQKLTFQNLAYNTPYQVETILTYDMGNGPVTEVLERTPIELVPKQVELFNVANSDLVRYENGQESRVVSLATAPTDLSNYFARVTSDKAKTVLLPVSQIREEDGVFKVSANHAELVHYREADKTYQKDYRFSVPKIAPAVGNVYTSFKQLIEDMNNNPSGNFVLGSDVSAAEIADNATLAAYVTSTFKGSLSGEKDGKIYTIYGLTRPLFNRTEGVSISKLNIADAKIVTDQADRAILVNRAEQTTISHVDVQGSIAAPRNVAGIVYQLLKKSKLEHATFNGKVDMTTFNYTTVGGAVAVMEDSQLQKAHLKVDMTVNVPQAQEAGGAVGRSNANSQIRDVYVEGVLNNLGGGRTGGFIGDQGRAVLDNVITAVKVTNGGVFSGMGYRQTDIKRDSIVGGVATGSTGYSRFETISVEQANERLKEMAIEKNADQARGQEIDYLSLDKAEAARKQAYRNMRKLLPFYNRHFIVNQGNKVSPTSKLYQTALVAVIPMKDDQVISDLYGQKDQINRIMLHFADGSIDYQSVSQAQAFKDTGIVDYRIGDTDLLYTPEQFLLKPESLIQQIASQLEKIDYYSDQIWQTIAANKTFSATEIANKKRDMGGATTDEEALARLKRNWLDELFLKPAYDQVKAEIARHLASAISQSSVGDFNQGLVQQLLTDKLVQKGLNLMLGATYMNRLYNIQFGQTNVQDLATYHQDFFGRATDHVDFLAAVGADYTSLDINRNPSTYSLKIAPYSGFTSLRDYLSAYRTRFTDLAENDWFKSATKAEIVEQQSKEVPSAVVDVYEFLQRRGNDRMILPLLTLSEEGIFILTTMSTITFGMYDRYINMNLAKTNPAEYQKKVAELKVSLREEAERQGKHFDFWYRIANPEVRDRLFNRRDIPIPTWDGYYVIGADGHRYWMPAYGETANARMTEFFGPIKKWFGNNWLGAYATGSETHFIMDGVVGLYGNSTFTHEMVHNFDSSIYLGGYGRREGMGAEAFALGMLQSITNATNPLFMFNSNVDYATYNKGANLTNRIHNLSPERFQNQADLQQYFAGMFDTLYSLDLLEANELLKLDKADQRYFYRTLTTNNNGEIIRNFTDEEWSSKNFASINDLIDNMVMLTNNREYINGRDGGRNAYATPFMFAGFFGATTSETGAPGTYTFKKMAFELTAEKGYNDGFLNYTSNKLRDQARNEGQTFSDSYIVKQIFNGAYQTFNDFKKAMYQRRSDKLDQMKTVTFTYQRQTYTNATKEQIAELMKRAVERDLANLKNGAQTIPHVLELKEAVYRAYLLQSDDFRQSIYVD